MAEICNDCLQRFVDIKQLRLHEKKTGHIVDNPERGDIAHTMNWA